MFTIRLIEENNHTITKMHSYPNSKLPICVGVPQMPDSGMVRLAVGLWLLASLIISTVYRSNLKAMLIIPKLELPFDSLEELVESGISVAVIEGSTMHLDVVVS